MSDSPSSLSAAVTLVLNDALGAVNEPEMSVPICAEEDNMSASYAPVNEPLKDPVRIAPSPFISAICIIV